MKKIKRKSWLAQSNERVYTAIRENRNKPGLYAIVLKGDFLGGFVPEKSRRDRYNHAEQKIRDKGYQGDIIFYNYLDPKKNYIFEAA